MDQGVKPFIDPRRTALLVIDMQKGFCHADSAMAAVWGTDRQRAIIPDVLKLVQLCRGHQVPVFWSQQVYLKTDVTRDRRLIDNHLTRQKFIPCLEGTWEVDLMDELAAEVRPEDYVLDKHRASFFQETTLPAKLRFLGIQMVLVAGVNTEFCVETSVREAYFRDFDVVVVRDCVSNSRPRFHDDTLAKIQAYFGEVVDLSALPSLILG